jgi:DNA mismatch endonuclease, patch repair protein
MGYRYRLHVHSLPGRPDLVFPRLKKIIQVQGCFWHQHAGCPVAHIPKSRIEYWHPKLLKNRRRDRQNEKLLQADGWEVLTIWECEVKEAKLARQRIAEFLNTRNTK